MQNKEQNITQTNIWSNLVDQSRSVGDIIISDLFKKEKNRAKSMSIKVAEVFFDYSKNLITTDILKNLIALAEEANLSIRIDEMFDGKAINRSENRSALHTALRADQDGEHSANITLKFKSINDQASKIKAISDKIRSKEWVGETGKPITDVINIGIGGSDLGPRMACTALKEFASAKINTHFVSNVDGTDINDALSNLNPETTLIIISSKTFTTIETLLNADKALAWLEKDLKIQNIRSSNHVIGVTANSKNAKLFGIDETRVVEFNDWVGGRYSIWSSIGLSLAISIGFDNFQTMLSGAREIDNHFRESPFDQNIPVIMAVLGIWYNNFLGAQSHAIIPYCERLTLFPSYLQQLDMESNGKSVDQNGEQLKYQTAPIIWGQTGTNGQHAFFQLLHQGTKFIPIDFIAPIIQKQSDDQSQKILLNNMLAQSMSLMVGKKAKEGENHKSYPGNKPSSTLLLNSLSPKTLGALIAIYEHKVFVQGTIWGINSFDQWGVELGKELSIALNKGNISNIDPSTDQLKDIISKFTNY